MALAGLAAGCGTSARTGGTAPAPEPGVRVTASSPVADGTGKEARAYAARLLGRLELPAGTRRTRWSAHEKRLLTPLLPVPPDDVVDARALYRARSAVNSVQQFLTGHLPPGTKLLVSGQTGERGGIEADYVNYAAQRQPSGISSAELATTIIPDGTGSLIRVDAQVTWDPPHA